MKKMVLSLIRIYQKAVSPFLGNHCRFYPSCSEYAAQAVDKKGMGLGALMALGRILRCQPFSKGGFDPIG